MANLRKFTLTHDEKRNDWLLKNDTTDKTVKRFDTKGEATEGGMLRRVLGQQGGSVKIQKTNGKFEEERTYPKSADPKSSKG